MPWGVEKNYRAVVIIELKKLENILSYLKPDNHRLLNRLELIIFQ